MIERLESGKWRVRLYAGSDYVASRTFVLKRDAREWEARQQVLLKSGSWAHPDDARVLYRDWLVEWLAVQGGTPATRVKREWALGYARDRLGRLPLSAISPAKVEKAIAEIRAEVGEATARQVLVVVRGSLRAAVREGLIPRDPTLGVKLPRARANEPRPLTHAQVWALASVLEPRDRVMVLVMGYGGLRWGEMTAVQPAQVTSSGVRIAAAYSEVQGRMILGDVKDHEARTVPLPAVVAEEAVAWARTREATGAALLVASATETPLRNRNWVRSVLTPAVKRAHVPMITPHNLRDTAASLAIEAGASILAVSRLLGHESASTTLRHYAGLMPDSLDGLTSRVDQAISAALRRQEDESDG